MKKLDKLLDEVSYYFKDKGTNAELTLRLKEQDKTMRELNNNLDNIMFDNQQKIKDLEASKKVIEDLKLRVRDLREYKEQAENEKPKTKLVYICSPLRGNIIKNKHNAKRYSRQAVLENVLPITPHIYFTQFLNDKKEKERKLGMSMAIDLLKICDELWVYGKPSQGMKKEIEWWELNTTKPIIKKEVK